MLLRERACFRDRQRRRTVSAFRYGSRRNFRFTQAEAYRASWIEYREFLRQFPEAMGL